MVCAHPITLQSTHGADFLVPCGKCRSCRAAKAREWSIRLKHEQSNWEREGFLTLTYSDENLPQGGKLVKEDYQKFWKRLRKNLDGRKIKYFACGEYGEKSFRPHYHAIVFGMDSRDLHIVQDSWKLGERIQLDPILKGGIEYVTGYVRKKIAIQYQVYRDKGLPFPFQLQSQGLGYAWAKLNEISLRGNGLTHEGKNIGIPRYYIRKLDLSSDDYYSDLESQLNDRDAEYKLRGLDWYQVFDDLVSQGLQHETNIKARGALFGN